MTHLARIQIYPIKSLDAIAVDQAVMLPSGGLQFDRQFALIDVAGNILNGKRSAAVHRLRTHYDLAGWQAVFRVEDSGEERGFHLDRDRAAMLSWLSDYFGQPLDLLENSEGGLPDDLEAPGPTVISTATLQAVASWFPELDLDAARQRFRANLELGDTGPFEDDCLFREGLGEVPFRVGEAELIGTNPCARCVVPSRDPRSGEVIPGFAKEFARQRQAHLPEWAPRDRFDHFYRLAVNTRPASGRAVTIRVGDPVEMI